jgi:hypothetical protein
VTFFITPQAITPSTGRWLWPEIGPITKLHFLPSIDSEVRNTLGFKQVVTFGNMSAQVASVIDFCCSKSLLRHGSMVQVHRARHIMVLFAHLPIVVRLSHPKDDHCVAVLLLLEELI